MFTKEAKKEVCGNIQLFCDELEFSFFKKAFEKRSL